MAERKIRSLMSIIIVGVLIKICLSFYTFLVEAPREPVALSWAESDSAEPQEKADNGSMEGLKKEKEEVGHRRLLELIEEKEKTLQRKEESLHLEEERLQALKKDIEDKLAQIIQASETLKALTISKNKHVEENIMKLAKVFESTPPENVGPLLEELDIEIAAQILLRMNGKKAGAVWGYVKQEKALKIIKEMSKLK
jgi:flagellar motility protein MotE (MotC chaperone)